MVTAMTDEELTDAANDFARMYYGVAFETVQPEIQQAIRIGLIKNEEREEREREESEEREERVTPDIGITDAEFFLAAIAACESVAFRHIPIGRARYAPATRAAIALGLRNTLREIEAQATDEALVAEEKA